MPDLNNIKEEVVVTTKKVLEDIQELSKRYIEFQRELESKFREELRDQSGKMDGLEDFYGLNLIVKRNCQNINNAFNILSKLKEISSFNIDEMSEEKKQLVELFN